MTDGNMATSISPVSEGEMEQIQNLFKKAADTIVAFSSLSGQVEKLQAQVNDLSNQVTRYRNHIDTQDDAMYRLRQEREELTNRATEAEHSRQSAVAEAEQAKQAYNGSQARLTDLEALVASLRKDRDDAEYRVIELEDKLKVSEKTLGKFRELAVAL